MPEYLSIARRTDRDILLLNKTELPDKVDMAMGMIVIVMAIDEFTNNQCHTTKNTNTSQERNNFSVDMEEVSSDMDKVYTCIWVSF